MTGDDLRESIGRGAHEAARRVLVEQGAEDHPLRFSRWSHPYGRLIAVQCECGKREDESNHHPDMVDWAALPEDRREYFRAVGLAGAIMRDHEIDQILGKALGYPNLPPDWDAGDDVCTGDNVPESLAMEAADEITRLRDEMERVKAAARRIGGAVNTYAAVCPPVNDRGDWSATEEQTAAWNALMGALGALDALSMGERLVACPGG